MAKQQRKQITVSPAKEGWRLQTGGKTLGRFDRKTDAVAAGVAASRKSDRAELVIQTKEGKIQDKRTYGVEPERNKG